MLLEECTKFNPDAEKTGFFLSLFPLFSALFFSKTPNWMRFTHFIQIPGDKTGIYKFFQLFYCLKRGIYPAVCGKLVTIEETAQYGGILFFNSLLL
jgi:hypothetical protein